MSGQADNPSMKNIGAIYGEPCNEQELHHICKDVQDKCHDQRVYLALQRGALRMRAQWHDIPYRYKRFIYLQHAADRAAKHLLDSVDERV